MRGHKVIWSSSGTEDFWLYEAEDSEVVEEFKVNNEDYIAYDYEPDIESAKQELFEMFTEDGDEDGLASLEEASNMDIAEMYCDEFGFFTCSVSDMRDKIVDLECYDYDYNPDYECLVETIIPNIEKKCYGGYLWLSGGYQTWRGNHSVWKLCDNIEKDIINICYPDYDSTAELFDDDGDLTFTEYSHDAPTGGTHIKFYSFKDRSAADRAVRVINKVWNIEAEQGEAAELEELVDDGEAVNFWVENGLLTPIGANIRC